jgi:hypothetical protein
MKTVLGVFVAMLLCAVGLAQSPPITSGYKPLNQTWESCEEMHDSYVKRFVSAEGFGLTRMMTPHMRDTSGTLDLGRTRYSIESIELVGLLQRSQPVVYLPSLHSSGAAGGTGTKRAPTSFEASALADFRGGKGMASQSEPGALRCIGAVRATEKCLECHENKKAGDLLGAFTYRLKTIPQ